MKHRTIPYGYTMKNGKNLPHLTESKIVQRIFNEYNRGTTMQKIAQTLESEKAEFVVGRHDWNKNRIKRILEDIRYLGNDTYPFLIDEDMFRKAQMVKNSKRHNAERNSCISDENNKSEITFRLTCPVECSCGTNMKRRNDLRRKISQQYWKCQNPDCKRLVNINDGDLEKQIIRLINRLADNPNLIKADIAEPEIPIEVRRLNNEISQQLDSLDFDKGKVKTNIFALASEKYMHIDNSQIYTQMLKAEFEIQTPLLSFSPELFKRAITKLTFDEIGEIIFILKNNQQFGKEKQNANNSNSTCQNNTCNPG